MKYLVVLVILLNLSCKSDQKEAIILEVHDFTGIAPYLELEGSKTYVVNFWATWCAPCVKELPHFETLQENYPDSVEVILVSLDFPHQYETKLKPFIQKHQLEIKSCCFRRPRYEFVDSKSRPAMGWCHPRHANLQCIQAFVL